MLQSVSQKRKQRSNRLTRCEPISPPTAIGPLSPCPDECQRREIRRGYFCLGCLSFHPRDQRMIDQSCPPPTLDPESRIAEMQRWIDSGELEIDQVLRLKSKIKSIQAVIDANANQPTIYRPHPKLKGGL